LWLAPILFLHFCTCSFLESKFCPSVRHDSI
jgi:hypothetical protein